MTAAPTSIETFRNWVQSRPDNEHWELIAGNLRLMAPATKARRRIASNLNRLLSDVLESNGPDLSAYERVGVNLAPVAPDYDPEPDVIVVDADTRGDERYSDRFYLVIEVVSEDNRATVEKKREIYKRHPDCRCILVVEQARIEVNLWTLVDGAWTEHRLSRLDDELVLEDFGLRCRLADLYRGTALNPRPSRTP